MDIRVLNPRLPSSIAERLRVPIIAAPMFRVSGPQLVVAACRNGVIGAFPTANTRTTEELSEWLTEMKQALSELDGTHAPICPNIVMRTDRALDDIACVADHGVELVITSVGSPKPAIGPLHDVGALVFADVATLAHARKAIDAGADGLILLTAGAGGQTGWLNPFAFVRAVRKFYGGLLVMAGGMSDGVALAAAIMAGCDLAYMGTRFIAATESMASDEYRKMLVASEMDDVMLTRAFNALWGNWLRPSIICAGLDPDRLDAQLGAAASDARQRAQESPGKRRWKDIWSAGHSVSGVQSVATVEEIIKATAQEYQDTFEAMCGQSARINR